MAQVFPIKDNNGEFNDNDSGMDGSATGDPNLEMKKRGQDIEEINEDDEIVADNQEIRVSPIPPDSANYTQPPYGQTITDMDLCQCARNGYFELAVELLKNPGMLDTINVHDTEGLTPLHYAARYNQFNIVKLLIENGAEIDCEDEEGLSPLHYACRLKRRRKKSKTSRANLLDERHLAKRNSIIATVGGKQIDPDASTIHYLIQKGADINLQDDYGLTALHHAALRGDEIACEELLVYETKLVHSKDMQLMTPMHTAACKGEPDIVRQLIAAGGDIQCRDEEESTPLHESATIGDIKTARIIFSACKVGNEPSQEVLSDLLEDRDEDGNTALMLAVESGRFKFVSHCISKGANVNTTNKWHMTALHLAAIKGDVRCVQLLIEHEASVHAVNHEHQTPFHKAALFNNTQCLQELHRRGADIEAKDKDNFTPLLLAACYGHAESVQLLLELGADVTVEDKNDRTAIYLAAEENNLEVLMVLLSSPRVMTMINNTDENSNGPLHIAAKSGHIRVVKYLLKRGADLFCKNDLEQTPIHMAAQFGFIKVVNEIVSKEKNSMSDGDEDSNTALHLAAMHGHVKLVDSLLQLGAEPEIRNSLMRTALGCAAQSGHLKVVKALVGSDAVIDPVDKLKMTPLLVAAQNGHADTVEFLLEHRADITHLDMEGRNCLDLAIDYDHVDVAIEIIKSDFWKQALRHSRMEKGVLTTPLRKLIRKMPEVTTEVFNKCVNTKKPEEGSSTAITDKYEVTFDFEFLDDLYNIGRWNNQKQSTRKRKVIEQSGIPSRGRNGWSKSANGPNKDKKFIPTWGSIVESYHRGKDLIPYTADSQMFKKNHPLMIMVDSSREELLDHPLVDALEKYKWKAFGRIFYYTSFIGFCIFLAFLTGYIGVTSPPFEIDQKDLSAYAGDSVCERYESSGAKQHVFANIGKYVILILSCFNIVSESIQAFHGKIYYLNWENLLDVCLFVCAFIFTLDIETCQAVTGYRTDWQWNFGAVAIVLAWIVLILYIQQFPWLGIYVVMFKCILYTFLRFSIVFLLFIIAFGLGFFCLIQNQTPYANPWLAVMRTAVMMIGEFDYNDIFHGEDDMHYWLTYLLMVVFVVIMSIIIMNLLVGLAVDDIKGVQDQAKLKRSAMKVKLVLDVERLSLRFTSRYFKESSTIYVGTADEAATLITPVEEFENQIQKSQASIRKKVDKVKSNMKQLKSTVNRIEDMLEAIMRAQLITFDPDEIPA